MNMIIEWKEETSNKDCPRYIATINQKIVAFATYIPLSKKVKFYSYHHTLVKDLDTESSKEFSSIERCQEYTQNVLNKIIHYAKNKELSWHYPNPKNKCCYLIFKNTNIALASIDKPVFDVDNEIDNIDQQVQLYQSYLFLFDINETLQNSCYDKLKETVYLKVENALAKMRD